MRPRSSIQSVIVFIERDGSWVPTKIDVNSWVALLPGKSGGHAKDAKKHGGSESMEGCYKAKVLKFRVKPGSNIVSEALVQHAYMWRQLDLNPVQPLSITRACNYLYPSSFKDWVDPECILGVIVVVHADIGELTRGERTHKELLQDSVFFYTASYVPRISSTAYGQIHALDLPDFSSPNWPLPDMSTSESYRAKLRVDFRCAMKPNVGNKQTRISIFMPIGVFVDLFSVASNMHKTPTMFVFKQVSDLLCSSLMDDGWDCKTTIGADVIKCIASRESLIFRYHIGRSSLYAAFVYNRLRMRDNSTWEAIDQFEPFTMVVVFCENGDSVQGLEVGLTWSLCDIREEISLQLGMHNDFDMWIVRDNKIEKINRRQEKTPQLKVSCYRRDSGSSYKIRSNVHEQST